MDTTLDGDAASLAVRNVGGIDEATVEIPPGVTALTGRNATNRTSMLQAIMAALGSDRVSLKGDADEGRVELTVGDETYTRTLARTDRGVSLGGDPYLDDAAVADLFAFLLEDNEARRAVARGDDLRELMLRPVDTDAIQAEIEQLEAEKRRIDDDLDDLDDLERRLPDLEERRTQLESEIAEKREEREAVADDIEAADANRATVTADRGELDEKLDELQSVRGDLDDVRFDVETERESLEALREERADLEAELDDLPEPSASQVEEIDAELSRRRDRREDLDSAVNELQTILQFNEEMVDGGHGDPVARPGDDDGAVTDELLADDTVTCWTCGSEVDTSQIESTLDRLRDRHQEKIRERNDLQAEIDDLQAEKRELEEKREERERVERKLEQVEDEINAREETLAELRERREELSGTVEQLEAEAAELEAAEQSELLDLHREANELQFEIDRLEDDLAEVESEIASVESRLDGRDDLESRRERVQSELTELRTRIDRIEADAVAAFNDHMETVLDLLDYGNVERIWIDRSETTVREGRRTVDRTEFDLHVVRDGASGAAYEDTVDHLSESEREVTGLVFALAGYLVHDVYESVPFVLLDSLEAIDSARIAAVVEYFAEYAGYLVVALLPEDAAELDGQHARVTPDQLQG